MTNGLRSAGTGAEGGARRPCMEGLCWSRCPESGARYTEVLRGGPGTLVLSTYALRAELCGP